jgi:hypothetical protein
MSDYINLIKEFPKAEQFGIFISQRSIQYTENWDKYLTKLQQKKILDYTFENIQKSLIQQFQEIIFVLSSQFEMSLHFNLNNTKGININALYISKKAGLWYIENLFLLTHNKCVLESDFASLQYLLIACNQAYIYQEILFTAKYNPKSSFNNFTQEWVTNSTATNLTNEMYSLKAYLGDNNYNKIWEKTILFYQKQKINIIRERNAILSSSFHYSFIKDAYKRILKFPDIFDTIAYLLVSKCDVFDNLEILGRLNLVHKTGYIKDSDLQYRDYYNPNFVWILTTQELNKKKDVSYLFSLDLYFDYFVLPFCLTVRRLYYKKFCQSYCQHLIFTQDSELLNHLKQFNLDIHFKYIQKSNVIN